MAANYWTSSQRQYWLFERSRLAEIRRSLEESELAREQFPLPDIRLFSIYINQQLVKLGKRLSTRQQALATAQVYVRRFYTRVEIRRTNPYLVLATAFYLACKMEECPQHIRFVVNEAHTLWPDFITSRNDVSKLGECEFWLISEMSSRLIVHHPYRTLSELQGPLGLAPDEVALAWSLINDHYLTDLPLLQPPHVVAVMAVFLTVVFRQPGLGAGTGTGVLLPGASTMAGSLVREGPAGLLSALGGEPGPAAGNHAGAFSPRVQRLVDWLAAGEVDIGAVVESTQELLSLYEVWEQYNEKACREQIGRFVQARGLDR